MTAEGISKTYGTKSSVKFWNRSVESLKTYEITIDYLDEDKTTPCGLKLKINPTEIETFKQMVKTFYTSIEIVFTEKNNVIVAKIPTLLIKKRVMATMNIYKTGTINIQAEGEPILELYKDIRAIVQLLQNPLKDSTKTPVKSTEKKDNLDGTPNISPNISKIYMRSLAKADSLERAMVQHQEHISEVLQKVVTTIEQRNEHSKTEARLQDIERQIKSYQDTNNSVLVKIVNSLSNLERDRQVYKSEYERDTIKVNECIYRVDASLMDIEAKIDRRAANTTEDSDQFSQELEETNITSSSEITINGNIFQGYAKNVTTKDEAFKFFAQITTSDRMQNREHCYSGYRTSIACIDTHEDPGSRVIKNFLAKHNVNNMAIIVNRHFGGEHIQNRRWEAVSTICTFEQNTSLCASSN